MGINLLVLVLVGESESHDEVVALGAIPIRENAVQQDLLKL